MLRSFLSFAALSLLAVACTQPAGDDATAADEINANGEPVTATPACTSNELIEGQTLFGDVTHENVFYAVPSRWTVESITTVLPYLESGNTEIEKAAERQSPMFGWYQAKVRLSTETAVSLDALKAGVAKAHPELSNVEVRVLPLEKNGDAKVSVFDPESSDAAKITVKQTGTTLDVTLDYKSMSSLNAFLTFASKKLPPIQVEASVKWACSGPERFRTDTLSGNTSSFRIQGEGITVSNEPLALDRAVGVISSTDSFLFRPIPFPDADAKALRDGINAAMRPILVAKPEAFKTDTITKKAAADAKAALDAFKKLHPDADAEWLGERIQDLADYQLSSWVEAWRP